MVDEPATGSGNEQFLSTSGGPVEPGSTIDAAVTSTGREKDEGEDMTTSVIGSGRDAKAKATSSDGKTDVDAELQATDEVEGAVVTGSGRELEDSDQEKTSTGSPGDFPRKKEPAIKESP